MNAVRPSPAASTDGNNQGPEPVARSFIMQFAKDIARGKYRGREDEMRKIQIKIDRALIAGKILNQ